MSDKTFLAYDPATLPASVAAFEAALGTRDGAAAAQWLSEDIELTDEGRTYRGKNEVAGWFDTTASQYTYTTEHTGQQVGSSHVVVRTHLEGDFPGGVVDLFHRYTLADGLITALLIEP